ncbi:OadG family transporter subunit [Pseudocolwellia sp. AS88]|jgi:oxaloacetate decarboxylase gamma subunit|uniref:OadG family protein n=1 Tax=Pseudocolwellia TaxID=2848177 RepID=UPI0026EAC4C5|nr:OadG family transporter subunit [Pseudocolwellia sp. AS88]MDO7086206.1 OadG family transporter subunit [Pseudocolwellia sp. AS88]
MEHLNELFIEAGTLMLAGMVFVFAFLGLLVIFINAVLAKLAIRYPDAKPQTKSPRAAKASTNSAGSVSPSVVAAISSAVSQYRSKHN